MESVRFNEAVILASANAFRKSIQKKVFILFPLCYLCANLLLSLLLSFCESRLSIDAAGLSCQFVVV